MQSTFCDAHVLRHARGPSFGRHDSRLRVIEPAIAAINRLLASSRLRSTTDKVSTHIFRSYAGFWVTRRSGGVVCRHLDDLDAVLESDTCDDLRQLICAFQPPPGL